MRYNSYLKVKRGHRSSKKDGRGREVYSARELDILPENGGYGHTHIGSTDSVCNGKEKRLKDLL